MGEGGCWSTLALLDGTINTLALGAAGKPGRFWVEFVRLRSLSDAIQYEQLA